jgi:hypothetical protein
MVLRRAQETEAFLGYFEIAATVVGLITVILRVAHIILSSKAETLPKKCWKSELWKIAAYEQQPTKPSTRVK